MSDNDIILVDEQSASAVVVLPQDQVIAAVIQESSVVAQEERQVVAAREVEMHVVAEGQQGPSGPPGADGPAGPPGPPGSPGGSGYVHDQSTPAATWFITHGLGRYPSVSIVDSAGTVVEGGVEYVSANVLALVFAAAFSGKAYLN